MEESNNKHAYLIMAHTNWNQLCLLLKLLDDYRNDIYIHIDKRSASPDLSQFYNSITKSNLYFIPRKKVYWADYSVVDVEIDLLEYANSKYKYRYYHLLSGMCLPIKTQDEIHDFFDNECHEFVAMTPNGGGYSEKHTRYYHPFINNEIYRKCKPLKAADRLVMYIQRILGIKRKTGKDIMISTGWQWFSITNFLCEYIIGQRDFIEKMFNHTLDSDEKFIGTLANKLGCLDKLYHVCPPGGNDVDFVKGSLRMIDWSKPVPRPYTYGRDDVDKDFEMLINSECMFARKFDEKENKEIIKRIYNYLTEKNETVA